MCLTRGLKMHDKNYHTKRHIEAINKLEKLNEHESRIRKVLSQDEERVLKDAIKMNDETHFVEDQREKDNTYILDSIWVISSLLGAYLKQHHKDSHRSELRKFLHAKDVYERMSYIKNLLQKDGAIE